MNSSARSPWSRFVWLALVLLSPCWGDPAFAATSTDLGYTRAQIFSGALRYLRIDLGYEVTERDAEAAYLLFRYLPQGKQETTFGAIEIIETKGAVRLFVKLPELPSYHEVVIRDGLVRKLRQEYGAEPEPRDPPKKPEPPEKAPDRDEPPPEDPPKTREDPGS